MQAQYIALTTPPNSLVLHHQYNGVKMTVGGYTTHKRVQKRQPAGVKPSKKRRTNSRPRPENTHTGRWTKDEHAKFLDGIKLYGKEWKKIASMIETRTVVQIRTHAQKYFQKLAKKKLLESGGRSAASSTALKSVATKKKGSRRKSSSRASASSSSSKPSPLLSLLLPTGGTRVKPPQESPTSVTDLNFHFPKLGPQMGTYPESASNLFSCDLPESPDVPLTNWLDDVSVRNDSDSSDCCTFLELGQKTIYADTSADKWDDPWDFDPDAFVTGSLLGDSL